MYSVGITELLVLLCALAVLAMVVAWPASRICRKAGFSPWLGVLAMIPVCNVILLWFLAYAEWPRLGARSGRPSTGT